MNSSQNEKNVSDKSCRRNQNTHFTFNTFFPPEYRAVYEIMWKNIVGPSRSQMTIWRMRIASRIPKATNTHSECTILYTATMVVRTLLSVTLQYIN